MKTRSGVLTSAIALSVLVPGLAFAYHFNFGALVEDTVIEDNVSPADILLHNWHGSWRGSMKRVIEYLNDESSAQIISPDRR